MVLRSIVWKAILVAATLTLVGTGFSILFPNATNYLLFPGMMIVYFLSGGVHGYSSGVYLPSLPVWYTLGGLINTLIYSVVVFWVLRLLHRNEG